MNPRDDSPIHTQRQPQQTNGVTMPTPFGFAPHFPNTNVFIMGSAAGVPSSSPDLIRNPNFAFNPLTAAPHPFETGLVSHPSQQQPPHPQQHHQQQNGSPAPAVSCGVTAAATVGSEKAKKKRGRPRKNPSAQDGVTLGLSVDSQVVSKAAIGGCQHETGMRNGEDGSREKKRGRPLGSGKKQLAGAGGAGSSGFTMHVLVVPAGENIVSKLLELSHESSRIICVLAANGPVQNVTLRQVSGGTIYLEGQFEIITMSGSFCGVNNSGSQHNTLNLSVSLAGSDSKIVGGGVTRELIAAASIQMIACSFISDKKQSNPGISITLPHHTPAPQMLSFGGSAPPNNSTQHDVARETSDDGSDGQGHPQNQTGFYHYGQQWTGGAPGWI